MLRPSSSEKKKKGKETKILFFSFFFFSRRANRPLASFDKFGPDRFSRTGRLLFHANHPHSVNFFIIFFFFWLENRFSSDTGRSFSMSDLVSIFKMYFIF